MEEEDDQQHDDHDREQQDLELLEDLEYFDQENDDRVREHGHQQLHL
jgi:hypothetical protein